MESGERTVFCFCVLTSERDPPIPATKLLPPPSASAASITAATRRARGLAACAFVFKIEGAAAAAVLPVAGVAAAARAAATRRPRPASQRLPAPSPSRRRPPASPPAAWSLGWACTANPGRRWCPRRVGRGRWSKKCWRRSRQRATRPGWPAPGIRAPAAVLVNNLGAISALELCAILAAALARLDGGSDWSVVRVAAGPLATSLDMRGVSLTLLPLTEALAGWLDAPAAAPGWPATGAAVRAPGGPRRVQGAPTAGAAATATAGVTPDAVTGGAATLAACIRAAAAAVTARAGDLDALDAAAGDGDCGETLAEGAAAAVAALDGGRLPLASPADTLAVLGRDVLGKMGRGVGTCRERESRSSLSFFVVRIGCANWLGPVSTTLSSSRCARRVFGHTHSSRPRLEPELIDTLSGRAIGCKQSPTATQPMRTLIVLALATAAAAAAPAPAPALPSSPATAPRGRNFSESFLFTMTARKATLERAAGTKTGRTAR